MTIRLLLPLLIAAAGGIAHANDLPAPVKPWQVVETKAETSTDLENAKEQCALYARPYLASYHVVVCEPLVTTSQRTQHWTEIRYKDEFAGVTRHSYSSSRSWSSESATSATIETPRSIYSFFSWLYDSGSLSSSSYSESPIVLQVPVRFDMSREVTDVKFGWRIVVRDPKVANDEASRVLFDSTQTFDPEVYATRKEAGLACAATRFEMFKFDYDVECRPKVTDDGMIGFELFGKKKWK
jgi:hypothetical protein